MVFIDPDSNFINQEFQVQASQNIIANKKLYIEVGIVVSNSLVGFLEFKWECILLALKCVFKIVCNSMHKFQIYRKVTFLVFIALG